MPSETAKSLPSCATTDPIRCGSGTAEDPFESTIYCRRGATRDNADGTVRIDLIVPAPSLPIVFASSPAGSAWTAVMSGPFHDGQQAEDRFTAVKDRVRDRHDGHCVVSLVTIPASCAPSTAFGHQGAAATVRLSLVADRDPFPYLVGRSERAAVHRRSIMLCQEPEFAAFLVSACRSRGVRPCGGRPSAEVGPEEIAAENLRRLAQIHTRAEILTSNQAAERVERLIRDYRDTIRPS